MTLPSHVAVAVLFSFMASAAGYAQGELPKGYDPNALVEVQALFECAALAAQAQEPIKGAGEAARLSSRAYELAVEALVPILPLLVGPTGTGSLIELYPFVGEASADFWVGTKFFEANATITDFLDGQAPYDGRDFDIVTIQRELAASLEFSERNCTLIGR